MLTLICPVETPFHRLRAGMKLAALCGFTAVIFALDQILPVAVALACVIALVCSCGPVFSLHAARMLRPLWPFVLVIGLWHWWTDDLMAGIVILLRLFAAVIAANIVTMTTRLSDIITVIETLTRPLSRPLARLGLPPRSLALAIALMIRFIPVMADRIAQLRAAWSARSARKPSWRILVPTTLAALDDADHVAEALRARGGTG